LFERLLDRGDLVGSEVLLSAGGSMFFDVVVERFSGGWASSPLVTVLLRSGCYLTHDAGIYERNSPFSINSDEARRFQEAIEVVGVVQSRPEANLVIVGVGRRDVPFDQGFPLPRTVRRPRRDETVDVRDRMRVDRLDDQHAYCELEPGLGVDVGDLVSLGVSHPCTAFDKWRVVPVLDEEDRVVDAVATFF
jgi:D-serine deaminase-like pyridoxal phosphate-dependent protein